MTKQRNRKSKYTFTLVNINTATVHQRYHIKISDNNNIDEDDPSETTKLTELNTEKGTPEVVSFLDESKRLHTCYISMVDFTSRMNVNLLRYHCFWCRHPFETRPIGCPIKYISSQVIKKYHSHISKDTYTIKENVTSNHRKTLTDDKVVVKLGEYYETDGVFCSFNCCKAYINDNTHNRIYDQSAILLMKMYNEMMKTTAILITAAPHWRTLEHYGGHMNIIKYRDGFNKVDYECHGNTITATVPRFSPLGTLYEEKIKF